MCKLPLCKKVHVVHTMNRLHSYPFIFALLTISVFYFSSRSLSQEAIACLSDEKTAYLSTEGYVLVDGSKTTKLGVSNEDCMIDCSNSDICTSFEYTKNATCRLNSNSVQKGLQLTESPGVTYFQKICIPTSTPSCGTVFARNPQKILIGYAQAVYNAPSLSACLNKCLVTSQPDSEFSCASLHFYYRDRQCILNSETKNNFPELFTPESVSEDEVDYVENNCYAAWTSWAPWTPCRGPGDGRKIRFRHCKTLGACGNDTGVQMVPCTPTSGEHTTAIFGLVVEASTEPTITDFLNTGLATDTTSVPMLPAAGTPDPPGIQTGCTSSYCKGDGSNPCQDFDKLGYASYGDCLREHLKHIERRTST